MRKLYPFLVLVFSVLYAGAQTTVQIGTGNEVTPSALYSPVYRFSATSTTNGSRSNILFTAAEMAAASIPSGATITKVEFNKTNTASFLIPATHQMLMANTSNSTLLTTTTWASILGTHTQVFSSNAFNIPSAAGWVAWDVTPFVYTGGSLEIATETAMAGNGGTDGPFQWEYTTGAEDKVIGVASATGATLNGTVTTYKHRPNIRITFTTGGCTNPAIPGQATSAAPASGVCAGTSVSLNLTGNSSGANQTYKWQSAATQFGTYTDISAEASSPNFTVNPTVTTWYRAVVKCGPSGTPQTSVAVQVLVNGALPAGTYTINNTQPTGGANFQSFADALSRMNCGISGAVVFDVSAGQTFVESPEISLQGTAGATVTFRKAGVGANPKLAKAGTSGTADYLVKITGADYINFDGIDFEQTGTSSSDWVEYGIFIVNASATNGSQNNTFKNGVISLSNANTAARAVFMDQVTTPTATSGTNSNNRFLNMTVQNSFTGYYLTGATNTYPDEDNEINTDVGGTSLIQNLGNGTAGASMYAVYCTYQSNFKLKNTQINNLTNGGTSLIYAVYFLTATSNSAEISGNTFSNISGGGTVTALYATSGASLSIFNNRFSSIRSTTATSSAVRAIDLTATGLTANIYANRFYDISSTGLTATTVGAIEVATGLVFNIYNNMISNLRAPGSTSTAGSVKGISVVGGSTGGVVRIYYNTVLLTDVGTAANYTSAGIYNSSTTPTLDIRNNLIVNRTDVSTGTRAVAFWKTSATVNMDVASDNNLYYAGTPSPKNLVYYDGTNSAQQISDYKLLPGISPREVNSVTENVSFLPITDGILRVDPNAQSLAESGGKEIVGYTLDFEGTQRGPYPLQGQANGAGTKPDLGADEYDGRGMDIQGPDINFVLLGNSSATTSRTLTATITDPSGVARGSGGPRLYYRKSGNTVYAFDATPVVNGSQYTFTFNYAAIGGVAANDVIEYYLAAQDDNGYGSTSPFGGSGVNPPGTTAPGTPATFRILYSLSGVYTVGATGNHLNLTSLASFLANSAEITGHTVFELQSDYDGTTGETFPVQFTPFLTSNPAWTVTIRLAAGVIGRTTSGDPGSSNPLINLNGVDRLTFDGRPGGTGINNEWTFRNTRTAATIGSVFRFINDATNDTLRFLTIEGQPTSTAQGLVHFSTSTGTGGNSFNGVVNNILRGRTDGTPTAMSVGIYASGTASALNSDIAISNNHIVNATSAGVNVTATGNGANWLISGNHIYADQPSSTAQTGITVASDNTTNTTISSNFIGGSGPAAAGTMTNTGNVAVNAINITGGIVNIANNTIANIVTTNTGTTVRTRGINFTSDLGGSFIQGNTIFNLSSMGGATGYAGGSQAAVGIHYFPAGYQPITIRRNTIYNISIDNTSPLAATSIAAGMMLTNMGGLASENRIYNIRNKTTGTTTGQPPVAAGLYLRFLTGTAANNMISVGLGETDDVQYTGILVAGGTIDNSATLNLYYNSVFVGGIATGGNGSYAFLRGDNTTTTPLQTINLVNNVLMNTRSGGSAMNYAIGNQGNSAATYWTSNYNVLNNANPATTGLWNATGYDFTGWKTASAGDAASQSFAVNFLNTATADLHLSGASVGNQLLAGTPVAGITTDFDLQARSTTRPYMGADEAAISLPIRLEYFTGVRQGSVHILNWKGHCTGDDNSFVVERSADGLDFAPIGELKASRTECSLPFAFADRNPLPGLNYYRLRIRDESGRVTYSFTLVLINRETGFEVVSVFPTPTQGNLWASVSSARSTNLSITVLDMLGRMVKQMAKPISSGAALVQLETGDLSAGGYLLRLTTPEGYEKSIRFVRQ